MDQAARAATPGIVVHAYFPRVTGPPSTCQACLDPTWFVAFPRRVFAMMDEKPVPTGGRHAVILRHPDPSSFNHATAGAHCDAV